MNQRSTLHDVWQVFGRNRFGLRSVIGANDIVVGPPRS
jgi:hypothetical protein